MDVNITGQRLRSLRTNRGLSQEQLTEMVNAYAPEGKSTTRYALLRVERGKHIPDSWFVGTLATVLDTTSDFLLGVTDDPGIPNAPNYPIPSPETWDLLVRVNDFPTNVRRKVADTLLQVLELSSVLATYELEKGVKAVALQHTAPRSVDMPSWESSQLANLVASLSPEQAAELLRKATGEDRRLIAAILQPAGDSETPAGVD